MLTVTLASGNGHCVFTESAPKVIAVLEMLPAVLALTDGRLRHQCGCCGRAVRELTPDGDDLATGDPLVHLLAVHHREDNHRREVELCQPCLTRAAALLGVEPPTHRGPTPAPTRWGGFRT